jgi:hypothetical protein
VAGAAAVATHPASVVAAVALLTLAGVGLALETAVWRHFRRRWAGDTTTHPMAVPQPLREPIMLTVSCAFLVGAIVWKAGGTGYSWTSGLFTGLGLLAFYGVGGLVQRWVER